MKKSRGFPAIASIGVLVVLALLCLVAVSALARSAPSESLFKFLDAVRLNSLSMVTKLSNESNDCMGNGAAAVSPTCPRPLVPERAIIIDTARNELMLIEGNTEVHRFPVGSASIRQGFDSPIGVFRVEKVEPCPPYYTLNPAKPIPGCDPKNPLGTAALWFLGRNYGIHGTSRPELIDERASTAESRRVSRGCFRMNNSHINRILPLVQTGIPVWIRLGQNSQSGGGQVIVTSQAGLATVALVRFNPGISSVVIEHRKSGQKFRIAAPRESRNSKTEVSRDRAFDSGFGLFAAYRLPLQINGAGSDFRFSFQTEREGSGKRLALRSRD
jgi:L,D-transpeptidase catalytic domain